jgi:hypothetical protein
MGIDTEQKSRVRRTIEDEEEDEKEKDHLQWAWPFSEKETKGTKFLPRMGTDEHGYF